MNYIVYGIYNNGETIPCENLAAVPLKDLFLAQVIDAGVVRWYTKEKLIKFLTNRG